VAILSDFYAKQNDTAEAISVAAVYDDGSLISEDLTGATVSFHMRSAAGTLLVANGTATVADVANKILTYQWLTGELGSASPGNSPHQAEFQITLNDGRILTVPNSSNINVHVFPEIA